MVGDKGEVQSKSFWKVCFGTKNWCLSTEITLSVYFVCFSMNETKYSIQLNTVYTLRSNTGNTKLHILDSL